MTSFKIQSQHFETFVLGKIKIGLFFWPGGNHKVPCSKYLGFLSDASGQRHLEAPATSRVQRVGPRGVCLERLRARPKETYRRIANIGPNPVEKWLLLGLVRILLTVDMSFQAFACFFFNLFTWNDGMRL